MSEHKLTGCRSRALFQIERAGAFLTKVMPVMPETDSDPLRQYLYQSSVLMVQSYFEEYLRCMVALGTFWKTPVVREHLQPFYPDEHFDVIPAAQVGQFAQRRVSFDEKARRLKEIFVVLTGGPPFADANAERKLLDFVNVRNIIAHRGGWPTDANLPTVESTNVIVKTNVVGTATFYKLVISRDFFGECLLALGTSITAVEKRVAADSTFRL